MRQKNKTEKRRKTLVAGQLCGARPPHKTHTHTPSLTDTHACTYTRRKRKEKWETQVRKRCTKARSFTSSCYSSSSVVVVFPLMWGDGEDGSNVEEEEEEGGGGVKEEMVCVVAQQRRRKKKKKERERGRVEHNTHAHTKKTLPKVKGSRKRKKEQLK
jgi:hypothetical protein